MMLQKNIAYLTKNDEGVKFQLKSEKISWKQVKTYEHEKDNVS